MISPSRISLCFACVWLAGCGHRDGFGFDLGVATPDAAAVGWPRGFDPPADCGSVLGVPLDALFDADVVRIALLLPESGPAGEAGRAMRQAVALALEELATAGGLPDGRRVGALACDSRTDPARAFDLVGWMANDFDAPAVIGPGLSASVLLLDSSGAIGGAIDGPLFLSPSATHPDLASLDDGGRFWRTAPDDARPARALGAWMAGRAERVAVIARPDRFGEALSAAVLDGFCGGPCPIQQAPGVAFGPGDAVDDVADTVVDLAVDGLILLGLPEESIPLLGALVDRAALPEAIGLGEPLYDPAVVAALPEATRSRVGGTRHARADSATAVGFAERYRARWGAAPGPFAAHAYDATWLIVHALGALPPGTPIDGAALAARLERMSAGAAIPTGPEGWRAGQALFRDPQAGTFDFDGASGPVDFDGRGEPATAVEGWGISPAGLIEDAGVWADADGRYRGP